MGALWGLSSPSAVIRSTFLPHGWKFISWNYSLSYSSQCPWPRELKVGQLSYTHSPGHFTRRFCCQKVWQIHEVCGPFPRLRHMALQPKQFGCLHFKGHFPADILQHAAGEWREWTIFNEVPWWTPCNYTAVVSSQSIVYFAYISSYERFLNYVSY